MTRRRLQDPTEFSVSKALQIREQEALRGYDLDEMMRQVVDKVVATVGQNPSVERMRQLGGFTAVIRTAIGPEPERMANELGFATSPEFYRWWALTRRVPELMDSVKARLFRPTA